MSQPACEPMLATIEKIVQDLQVIDAQLQNLENEGMKQLNPWPYFVLQPQSDRLNSKKQALQMAWYEAMTELAICRSGQSR